MRKKIVIILLIVVIICNIFLITTSLAIDSENINNMNNLTNTSKNTSTNIIKNENANANTNTDMMISNDETKEENVEYDTENSSNVTANEEIEENYKQESDTNKAEEINNSVKIDTQILEEGIYEIYAYVGETKVIDVHGADKNDKANIEIYERMNQNNQKYRVQLNDDGTYTFFALHSNKVLDVEGNGKSNETNVCQYTYNGGDNQKWYIESCGNGYYYIISKANGLYLDVYQTQGKDGQNIQMYQKNEGLGQKFKFSKVIDKGTKTIENGIYNIYSNVAKNRLLEVPNSEINDEVEIKTATNKNIASQKFQVTYNNDGTYTILVLHTGKALDVKYGSGKNKTAVQQYTKHDGDMQKWIIKQNTNGTYSLIAKCNGLALDIDRSNTSVGAKVQTFNFHGEKSQQFIFEECKETDVSNMSADNGTYRILSTVNPNKVMQFSNNSIYIQMWENANSLQQKYEIVYGEDGYYKIKSKKSNKFLTVESATPTIGSKIKQEEGGNLDTQKWILKKYSESIYAIISKCGNLYITLSNSNIQNGQTLQLALGTDLSNQRFILVNETPKNNIKQIENGVYQIITKGNKVLDIYGASYDNVANAIIFNNSKAQNQKFQITRVGDTNYYKITAIHSAKVLDVESNNTNIGANVIQFDYSRC